jgi:hypothetical protein
MTDAHNSPMRVLVFRDLDRRGLTRPLDRVLQQLSIGDFRSAEVKKLKGRSLFRARIDDRNRLLFRIGHDGRERSILVLEVIHNHEYEKSRILAGGTITDHDFLPADPHGESLPALEKLKFVHPKSDALFLLDKPISFDDAQMAVIETPLPLVVIGSAGSGKTALMLEKLKTLPGRVLYLTRSSFLVMNARALYAANGYENLGQEVDFLSLSELIETIRIPPGREATWKDFETWFAKQGGNTRLYEPRKLWEEFKGVLTGTTEKASYISFANYEQLGIRQTLFLGAERAAAYQLFQRWLDHMHVHGIFDANMAAWETQSVATPLYDAIVVDEVQDITNVELRLLFRLLVDRKNLLLCGDANQIVHPNLFSWARLRDLFWGDTEHVDPVHILTTNYRNTQAVTTLANRLLLIKQQRFGSIDRESNYLVQSVGGEEGSVDLLLDSPTLRLDLNERTRRSTRYAVVVLRDEDKATAREAFSTPLVFSVHEAKGLEYENVVLFGIIDSAAEAFRECTAGIDANVLNQVASLSYARARDKTDKSLDTYKFYINSLYVAITRASRTLLIVEPSVTHPLFALLSVQMSTTPVSVSQQESSKEEWQKEASKLELQGKHEQAAKIRADLLGIQPVPWKVTTSETYADLSRRSFDRQGRSKDAQQALFEFAVTYRCQALFPALVAAEFRHAKKPEAGKEFIERTHYKEYLAKSSPSLMQQVQRHGPDFRNPLNETPLMVAARLGNAALVSQLLAAGANRDLVDNIGRSAVRMLLESWLEGRFSKGSALIECFRGLATTPIRARAGGKLFIIEPRTFEWFLLHFALARLTMIVAETGRMILFDAGVVASQLARFPHALVPEHRKKRTYVSSILSKNEAFGSNPYCRRLFIRVGHGKYALNPQLEVMAEGQWRDTEYLAVNENFLRGSESAREQLVASIRSTRIDMEKFLEDSRGPAPTVPSASA